MTSVFVGVPHTRAFEGEFADSLLYMLKPERMIWSRAHGFAVDAARNLLVERYLQEDPIPDYLLMVDSDATFPPEALQRLISRDKPVITACIYRRGLPPVPTFGPYVGLSGDGWHSYNFGWSIQKIRERVKDAIDPETVPNSVALEPGPEDVVEIDGTGLHFCLIRRDVITALNKPLFQSVSIGGGEDFYFCRAVKKAGFKIYADLSVHTGHLVGAGMDFGLREMIAFMDRTDKLDVVKQVWDVGMADIRLDT